MTAIDLINTVWNYQLNRSTTIQNIKKCKTTHSWLVGVKTHECLSTEWSLIHVETEPQNLASLNTSCIVNLFEVNDPVELWSIAMHYGQ